MPKGKEQQEEEIPWEDGVAGAWFRGVETPSPLWESPEAGHLVAEQHVPVPSLPPAPQAS